MAEKADYVLGRTAAEHQRLDAQAQVWIPATRSALARAWVSSGMTALDAGCGTGSVMRLIAEAVGPSGRVLGIDIDEKLGSDTLGILTAEGPDIFEFETVDAEMDVDRFREIFDLVFTRLYIVHTADPLRTLRRLWSWVKPGGTILVMDVDLTSQRTCPPHPSVLKAWTLMRSLLIALGKEITIGTEMPELFIRAGIPRIDGCDVWSHLIANDAGGGFGGGGGSVRATLNSLRRAALAGGHTDAATLDQIDRELSEIPEGQFMVRLPDMVATWARKSE